MEKWIIFGVDNKSSVQFDNRKDILILGNGLTDRLSDTTINAEAKYSISFSEPKKTQKF